MARAFNLFSFIFSRLDRERKQQPERHRCRVQRQTWRRDIWRGLHQVSFRKLSISIGSITSDCRVWVLNFFVFSTPTFLISKFLNICRKKTSTAFISTLSWLSISSRAGTLVKWLWEETHVLKVVGLNPSTIYWMDIFSHWFVVKIVMMFVWKDEINK